MTLVWRLLTGFTMMVAISVVPIAIIVSFSAALLAGQTEAVFDAGVSRQLDSNDGRQQLVENLVASWEPASGADLESEIATADLETAFGVLIGTAAFRTDFVESARAVGASWDAGEGTSWTLDLSNAVREATVDLAPTTAEVILADPVIDYGSFPSPGFDRAWEIAGIAAALAVALLAALLFLTRNPWTLSRPLTLVAPHAALLLVMLYFATNSETPTSAAIGEWLRQRLQVPLLLAIGFGVVLFFASRAHTPPKIA